jgi:Tfp pilus assembly protein PilN
VITINLLPIAAFKEKYTGKIFLAAYAIAMLILGAALFSIKTNMMDTTLASLQGNLSSQQNQLTALQKQVTDASAVTKVTFQKWEQLVSIIELEERRRDQTRLFVELEQLLPKNDAWYLSLSHDKGTLSLEAISRDKDIVSQFLKSLEEADYIDKESVNLLEITQDMVINGMTLTKFKVTAKTVFPIPEVIDQGMPDFGLPSREAFLKTVEAAAPDLVANIKTLAAKSGRAL